MAFWELQVALRRTTPHGAGPGEASKATLARKVRRAREDAQAARIVDREMAHAEERDPRADLATKFLRSTPAPLSPNGSMAADLVAKSG